MSHQDGQATGVAFTSNECHYSFFIAALIILIASLFFVPSIDSDLFYIQLHFFFSSLLSYLCLRGNILFPQSCFSCSS